MKRFLLAGILLGLCWSGVGLAGGEDPAFTVTDMAKVSTMALEELNLLRPEVQESIYRVSFSFQANNTVVTFFSRSADGSTERISMGCHAHDGIEECHLRS